MTEPERVHQIVLHHVVVAQPPPHNGDPPPAQHQAVPVAARHAGNVENGAVPLSLLKRRIAAWLHATAP